MGLSENIKGIHHVSVSAYDGEAASRWYQENLGFELVQKKITAMNGKTEFFLLRKGNLLVELVQPHGRLREETRLRKIGVLDHYAIDTADLDVQAERALRKGMTLHGSTPDGITSYPHLGRNGVKGINFTGPEGEVIEFCHDESTDYSGKTGLLGFAHLALKALSLEHTEEFYGKLGFCKTGEGYLLAPDGKIRVAFLEHQGYVLEIIETDKGGSLEEKKQGGRIDHFALEVSDVREALYQAQKAKLPLLNHVIQELPLMEQGVKYFFVQGPDGERIEFVEIVSNV